MNNISQNADSRAPVSFRRQALKAISFDALIFILIVGICEGSIRLFMPSLLRFTFGRDITGGHKIQLNSIGIRDDEIDRNFPENGVRILFLGNSVTFGTGVEAEDAMPAQLERILKSRHDKVQYDVINAGGQGRSINESIEFLKKYGLELHPDAVVLVFTPDHVIAHWNILAESKPETKPGYIKKLMKIPFNIHVALYKYTVSYAVFDRLIRHSLFTVGLIKENLAKTTDYIYGYAFDVPGVNIEQVKQAYNDLENELKEMNNLLASNNIPLILVSIPCRFELSNLNADNHRRVDRNKIRIHPSTQFQTMAERLNLPFLNMQTILQKQRKEMMEGLRPYDPLYVEFDVIHINPTGHRLAAENILSVLQRLNIIPDKK